MKFLLHSTLLLTLVNVVVGDDDDLFSYLGSYSMNQGSMMNNQGSMMNNPGSMNGFAAPDDDFAAFLYGDGATWAMTALAQCEVDIESLMGKMDIGSFYGYGGADESMQAVQEMLDVVDRDCMSEETKQFDDAMKEFETCAGYNLEDFIETFPNSLIGAEMACLKSIVEGSSGVSSSIALNVDEISEQCADYMLGANPLGELLRSLLLRPDQTLPCFTQLSESLPDCTKPAWPMPIVGPILKIASCLIGMASPLFDSMCAMELTTLDQCLPPIGAPNQCNDGFADCEMAGSGLMMLPVPLLGMPLSDACQRVGQTEGMSDAVDRYESFRTTCTDIWPGWEATSTVDVLSLENGSTSEGGQSEEQDQSSGYLSFLSGLASGLALVGLALVAKKKGWVNKVKGFETIDGDERNDLTLT